MIRIEPIDEKSPHLDVVKRLWRANSDWLGFFPDGAFLDRARRRQILVALKDGVCCGYLIYSRTGGRKVRINHLCVKDEYRDEGITRRIIEYLRNLAKDDLGISLHCRRDFPAWGIWPKLGFVALDKKRGRGQDGGELTYYWLPNPQASLLSLLKPMDDERPDVALDANVFYDLHDPARNGAEETQGIIADWFRPLARLCITDELFNEIQRHPDRQQRAELLRAAKDFDHIECTHEDFQAIESEVRGFIGEPKDESDAADIRQVARVIASRTTIFVTRDEPLLGHAEEFYAKYGLSVVRPSELIGQFDELRNEQFYQKERLAGTKIGKKRISRSDEGLASTFQDSRSSEKKRHLEQRINTFLSDPEKYECFVVADDSGTPGRPVPLALFVVDKQAEHVSRIPLFRLSTSIRSTRTATTLFRTLLAGIIENSCRSKTKVVIFDEPRVEPAWAESLRDSGFTQMGSAWLKLSLRMLAPPDSIGRAIRSSLTETGLACGQLEGIADHLMGEAIRKDSMGAWQAEHILWPAKILGCGIPSYIIPIRPGWASDLFDSGLALGRLWGADADLALNPESVYYRSARNGPSSPFGRLLWYVSQGKRDPETMRIRACSRLADVVVGQAKDLFKEFRRLGVYEWKDALETAKGDPEGRIMALKFDDNELFPHPPKWDEFQAILKRHGKNTNLQSPTEIPEDAFLDLHRLGFGFEND